MRSDREGHQEAAWQGGGVSPTPGYTFARWRGKLMITTCILNKYIYPGVYVFDARGMHYTYPRGMRFFPSCKLLKMLNLTHTPSPLINPPRGMCWGREEVTKLKKGRTPMATPTGMEMGGEALNLIGMEEGQVLLE